MIDGLVRNQITSVNQTQHISDSAYVELYIHLDMVTNIINFGSQQRVNFSGDIKVCVSIFQITSIYKLNFLVKISGDFLAVC